ncbi:hypothetical protein PAXRUDRAFT_620361 [Paxillus rubicundulus Ve08.2h10]|uniref:Uncharacterized protein n=1 Tax=Paxillus rubicundulus Ve08.2h10 TaxID=930991 RepID=A0A0D0DKE8_9AGAM|nr:hypothetical protein PAXRUDRAFT_620361 [Paxillus rubicundulus Ve08.2h10]
MSENAKTSLFTLSSGEDGRSSQGQNSPLQDCVKIIPFTASDQKPRLSPSLLFKKCAVGK